jgi:hypothetical protein
MKNLAIMPEDKLEDLGNPNKWEVKDYGCECCRRRGKDYPWKRVNRWLRSKVGEPWSEVFSAYTKLDWILPEFRTLKRIKKSVETETFMEDKVLYYFDNYSWRCEAKVSIPNEFGDTFYVHPQTHTLEWAAKLKRPKYTKPKEYFLIIGDYHQIIRLDGIWYEVKAIGEVSGRQRVHYPPNRQLLHDSTTKRPLNGFRYEPMIPYGLQPPKITKRQLNKKELKKFGLVNIK